MMYMILYLIIAIGFFIAMSLDYEFQEEFFGDDLGLFSQFILILMFSLFWVAILLAGVCKIIYEWRNK